MAHFTRSARSMILVLWMLLSGLALANDLSGTYSLDAGDRIRIHVFGEPDLSFELLLGDRPVINYPFLGDISVQGLSTRQLEQRLADGLRGDYLLDPVVQVSVTEYRPFYIFGEVRRPGSYPYQPGLTVNQALALAGGLTDRANSSSITIFSPQSSQPQEGVAPNQAIAPGDTLQIGRRFF